MAISYGLRRTSIVGRALHGVWVRGECEREESDAFLIGQIVRVNKKSVTLRGFDALGRWDEENTRVSYGDITLVTFDDEYITVFSKYLRDR